MSNWQYEPGCICDACRAHLRSLARHLDMLSSKWREREREWLHCDCILEEVCCSDCKRRGETTFIDEYSDDEY